MHALLASMGSAGDVHPFVGLGVCLASRGYRVTLAANGNFQSLAAENGLDFHPLVDTRQADQLLAHPHIWHPFLSGLVGARWGVAMLGPTHQVLQQLVAKEKVSILVSYPPVLAARLLQEQLQLPMVSIAVMPWMIPTVFEPAMAGMISPPLATPRPIKNLYWNLLHQVGDLLVGRHVNRFRRSLRLPPIRRVFDWWVSPLRVIGMFPDWYAPLSQNRMPQLRLAGFPLFDRRHPDGLPERLLAFCRSGPPPIALTFGTANRQAALCLRPCLEACALINARAICLSPFADQLPHPLPAAAILATYAPFSQLFPHCAAVVHHGGLGTTAQCLAAGVPQLVLPMAFDQPDNAARVARLGVGAWLKPGTRPARIAEQLARILQPHFKAECQALKTRVAEGHSFQTAADYLEAVAGPVSGEA